MADFCHPHCTLVGGSLTSDQLIFQVNFNHFAHQPIGCAAHGGDLLQNCDAGFAVFQRPLQRVNLAANTPHPRQHAFFYLQVNGA